MPQVNSNEIPFNEGGGYKNNRINEIVSDISNRPNINGGVRHVSQRSNESFIRSHPFLSAVSFLVFIIAVFMLLIPQNKNCHQASSNNQFAVTPNPTNYIPRAVASIQSHTPTTSVDGKAQESDKINTEIYFKNNSHAINQDSYQDNRVEDNANFRVQTPSDEHTRQYNNSPYSQRDIKPPTAKYQENETRNAHINENPRWKTDPPEVFLRTRYLR